MIKSVVAVGLLLCNAYLALCQQSNVSIALSTWAPGIASLYGGDIGTDAAKEYGATIGSCGYADIPVVSWPFLSIAALPTTGQGYLAGPAQGCGTCYQITCVDDGPDFNGKCNPDAASQSVTVQVSPLPSTPHHFFGRVVPRLKQRICHRLQLHLSPMRMYQDRPFCHWPWRA